MKKPVFNPIDTIFKRSIRSVATKFRLAVSKMTLRVQVLSKGSILLEVCKNDSVQTEIPFETLMNAQMIGMRFGLQSLKDLFEAVHHAFILEYELENPRRISMILYESLSGHCACLGVLLDGKPVKALRVSEIFYIMGLGDEQLN